MKKRQNQTLAKMHSNYVYLLKRNYVDLSADNPMSAFKNIRGEILKRVASQASQQELQELAIKYNEGKDLILGLTEGGPARDTKYQEAILNVLGDGMSDKIQDLVEICWDRIAIKGGGRVKKAKRLSTKGNDARYVAQKNRILKMYQQLDGLIQNIKDVSKKDREELKIMKTNLIKYSQIISAIFKDADVNLAIMAGEDSELIKIMKVPTTLKDLQALLIEHGIISKKSKSGEKILNQLKSNELIIPSGKKRTITKETAEVLRIVLNGIIISMASVTKSKLLGDFFELFLKAAFEATSGVAAEALEDNLRKSLKNFGGRQNKGTLKLYGPKDTLKKVMKSVPNMSAAAGEGKVEATIEYQSQQKADLIVKVNDKVYPISAKNYNDAQFRNFEKMVTLSDDSPLLTHLLGANELYPTASRHFLNILATQPIQPGDSLTSFASIRQEGLDTLSLVTLYQGLTGRVVGKQDGFAKIFAFNNSRTGETMFFDVNTIISYFANQNLDSIMNPKAKDLKLYNSKLRAYDSLSQNVKMRLAIVLKEAHRKKIKIQIPADELKEIAHSTAGGMNI